MANKNKYDIKSTAQFKKDYKLAKKRGLDIKLLAKVINTLAAGEALPATCKDHSLKGKWNGYRECHIQPDWLLVYQIIKGTLVLTLSRTGTHSDIFGNE